MSEMPTFDPKRMRFPTLSRKPFPGTRVRVNGTTKHGSLGIVVADDSPEFKNCNAVEIGGVTFGFYTHQLIEILADE